MQNTLNKKLENSFIGKQKALIESLNKQPLIIVIRLDNDFFDIPEKKKLLFANLRHLSEYGIRHIEIGWDSNIKWVQLISEIQSNFAEIHIGAASITCAKAFNSILKSDLQYSMSPFFDKDLQQKAKKYNQLLIPGISNTQDLKEAIEMGYTIIKIFPASKLGIGFLNNIKELYRENLFLIGAGGLQSKDLNKLLTNGYNAIALGRGLIDQRIDQIIYSWLKKYRQ